MGRAVPLSIQSLKQAGLELHFTMHETNPMSDIIRVGFVGAGANTRLRHLPGFAAMDGVRLAAVANRSADSSNSVAGDFKIAKVARGWREIVDDPEIDAICIGTWPYMHAEITVAALEAGKHVLTEARMAANLGEARAMHAASKAHPWLVAQIVPSPFTLDLDTTVRGLVEGEVLGDIIEVAVDHSYGAHADPDAPLSWRQDPRFSGINIMTLGIYHEAVQRWFKDLCQVTHVSSRVVTPQRIHWESGELVPVVIPDVLQVAGCLERGTLLNYHFSSVEKGPGCNRIKLTGTRATLRVDIAGNALYLSDNENGEQPVVVPESERRGWQVEADFIGSIRDGRPVELTSFDDGLRYMEFTDAVHRGLPSLSC